MPHAYERGWIEEKRRKATAAKPKPKPLHDAPLNATTEFDTTEFDPTFVELVDVILDKYDAMRKTATAAGGGGAARLVWREVSPQHFAHHRGGLFPGKDVWAADHDKHEPCVAHAANDTAVANLANLALSSTLRKYPWVQQLPIWELSAQRPDAHPAYECTHWCQPGPVSTWVIMLQHLLALSTDSPRSRRNQ